MSDDIVERLRGFDTPQSVFPVLSDGKPVCRVAADEIERLRALLAEARVHMRTASEVVALTFSNPGSDLAPTDGHMLRAAKDNIDVFLAKLEKDR